MDQKKMTLRGIYCTFVFAFLLTFGNCADLRSQSRTVGLILNQSGAYGGYTLFAPFRFTETYLIDNDGLLVHSWSSDYTPASAYLLENGNLLRGADHKANPKFDLNYVHPDYAGQADWLHLNAIDHNAELDQIVLSSAFFGEIWIIDHSTTSEESASHAGGEADQGGDILYRWGNPRAYGHGTGMDKQLFFQHNPEWIQPGLRGAGNILIFNNGADRPETSYSSIIEIETPVGEDGRYHREADTPFGPSHPTWTYTSGNRMDFFSPFISGAQRLPNGNTLICSGMYGVFFEINESGETVWEYVNPVTDNGPLAWNDPIPQISGFGTNMVFRANRQIRSRRNEFRSVHLSPENLEVLVSPENAPYQIS